MHLPPYLLFADLLDPSPDPESIRRVVHFINSYLVRNSKFLRFTVRALSCELSHIWLSQISRYKGRLFPLARLIQEIFAGYTCAISGMYSEILKVFSLFQKPYMSDNCCLPFDVTLYIFKVSVVIVFIKLFTQCNEIQNTAKCLTFRFEVNQIIALLVSQKLTVLFLFLLSGFRMFHFSKKYQ